MTRRTVIRSTTTMVQLLPPIHADVFPASLEYDPAVPWEVTLHFDPADADPPWTVSREVMLAGLGAWSGDGDFRCRTVGDEFQFVLESPEPSDHGVHHAMFAMPVRDVALFLDRTMGLVPLGEERLDEAALEREYHELCDTINPF